MSELFFLYGSSWLATICREITFADVITVIFQVTSQKECGQGVEQIGVQEMLIRVQTKISIATLHIGHIQKILKCLSTIQLISCWNSSMQFNRAWHTECAWIEPTLLNKISQPQSMMYWLIHLHENSTGYPWGCTD